MSSPSSSQPPAPHDSSERTKPRKRRKRKSVILKTRVSESPSKPLYLNRVEAFSIFTLWTKECTSSFFGFSPDFEQRSRTINELKSVLPKFIYVFANPHYIRIQAHKEKSIIFYVVASKLEKLIQEFNKIAALSIGEGDKSINFYHWLHSSEGAESTLYSFKLFHQFLAWDCFVHFFAWLATQNYSATLCDSNSADFVRQFQALFEDTLLPQYLMLRNTVIKEEYISNVHPLRDTAGDRGTANKRGITIETSIEPVSVSFSAPLSVMPTFTEPEPSPKRLRSNSFQMDMPNSTDNGNDIANVSQHLPELPISPSVTHPPESTVPQSPKQVDVASGCSAIDSCFLFSLVLEKLLNNGHIPLTFFNAFLESPKDFTFRTCLQDTSWLDDKDFVAGASFYDRKKILFTLIQTVEFYFPKEVCGLAGIYWPFYLEINLKPLGLAPFGESNASSGSEA